MAIDGDEFTYTTINNAPAIGICGSGIVDLLAEMLLSGYMDKQGKLIPEASPRIVEKNGERAIIYAYGTESASGEDLYFSESDILAFRDTKAAANTMVACLLEATEVSPDDIEVIYTVGGFGEHINFGISHYHWNVSRRSQRKIPKYRQRFPERCLRPIDGQSQITTSAPYLRKYLLFGIRPIPRLYLQNERRRVLSPYRSRSLPQCHQKNGSAEKSAEQRLSIITTTKIAECQG